MGVLARSLMVPVGLAVLAVYSAVAVGWLVVVQWVFADPPGLVALLVAFFGVVLVTGYVGYRLGTVRLVASLDAVELPVDRAPELYRRLERLCMQSRVSQPDLLVADLGAPNALSIGGPRRGVVVLDRHLFRLLTIDELEGILAHELAHMERLDTFWNTLAVTAARTLVGLVFVALLPVVIFLAGIDRGSAWIAGEPGRSRVGLAGYFQQAVLFGIGAVFFLFTLVFLSYSRRQEFAADRRATDLTGNPVALARALAKLHRATNPRRGLLSLLYVHDDPSTDRERWLSTHPPLDDRIDRLLEEAEVSPQQYVSRLRPR
jgi:heat shock protein HtpX